MSFQLEPVLALVRGEGCRFLIADAVGLGKTVQAGLMIAETLARRPEGRTLVVTPAALREQWREEIESRFGLGADILDAAGIARLTSQLPAGINPWSVRPVVITSIDYIKRPEVMRSIETLIWDLVVFDEAHNLAGRSDRSAAAGAIGNRARALVLLTATPHSGDDQAFDRLCQSRTSRTRGPSPGVQAHENRCRSPSHQTRHVAACPSDDGRSRDAPRAHGVREAGVEPIARCCRRRRPTRDVGAGTTRLQQRRLACALGRTEVGAIGTARLDAGHSAGSPVRDEVIDDDEPAVSLRSPGLPDAREERSHLLRLLDLARDAATAESKLAALRRLISRVNEPVIVFTEYRDTLREISATLSGIETVQLHGGLTARERNDALRRFIDGTVRVLLATDAASEGLNLHQRCRLVINLELPWTPLRLEQRAGRVDRIGQSDTVHVVRFVAKGTCEETTVVRLARRIARIQGAMQLTSSIPNERRVAESILGDAPIPDVEPAAGIGSGGALNDRSPTRGRARRQGVSPALARCSTQIRHRRQTAGGHRQPPPASRSSCAALRLGIRRDGLEQLRRGGLRTAGGAHGRTPSRGRAVDGATSGAVSRQMLRRSCRCFPSRSIGYSSNSGTALRRPVSLVDLPRARPHGRTARLPRASVGRPDATFALRQPKATPDSVTVGAAG